MKNLINYETAKKYLATKTNLSMVEKLLNTASESYYNTDSIILSDDQYDELYKSFKKITGKEIIGAKPNEGSKTVSVAHDYQNLVGTLDKAKNLDEVKPFLKRYSTLKTKKNYMIRLSLKFDGNSVTIEYDENGKPKKALTRGKDGKGKDIINIFKNDKINMSQFNLSCLDSEFAIKYEIIIEYSNYDKLCKELNEDYANPRSLVSGILNSNEGAKYRKYLTLVPLEMRVKKDGFNFENGYKKLYSEEIEEAFKDNYFKKYSKLKKCSTLKEVEKNIIDYYYKVNDMRNDLPFMIDGIVVEILNEDLINKFFYDPRGFVPQYSFAVKLPYLESITKVTNIDYCVGCSGRITPRIHFEPVSFNGTTHTKQQISNYKRFKELNLGIGSKILVSYHNDCLSYITKIDEQDKNIKPFKFITKCPICNEKITIRKNENNELTLARCTNVKCNGRIIGKINNYFIKMDIKGIRENIIQTLFDCNIITDIPSIYEIDYNKVAKELGPKMAKNIQNAIESKEYYDYEILGSLSIDNISLENAKIICKNYTLDEIIDLYNSGVKKLYNVLIQLEGFSDIKSKSFINGFTENADIIEYLYDRGYKVYKDNFKNANLNINIVATGWRPTPDMSIKMESMGIKLKSSVSKKVDLLVYSDNPGATKVNKARELGIKTIFIDDFVKKFNL